MVGSFVDTVGSTSLASNGVAGTAYGSAPVLSTLDVGYEPDNESYMRVCPKPYW